MKPPGSPADVVAIDGFEGSVAVVTIVDGTLKVRLTRDRWQLESRHVLATEGGGFSQRVKAKSELDELLTPGGLAHHRDGFVETMRAWYAEGKPLGNWTIPYRSATRRTTCSTTPGRCRTET